MLSLYQPLIENARFYRLFCLTLILFMLAVLAYLVGLMQMAELWLIVAVCSLIGLIYLIYLYRLTDAQVLAKAEQWIERHNQRLQNSADGLQADALALLVLIFPFVLMTWLLYGGSTLLKK
ncbi:hypothetical protein [Acinetobacter thermotolerans]|uniref:hypothetical protein n=2 Tax=Acinetobacter thermotolerans TaxID=3151487 RepID=UPI00325A73F5